MGKSRWLLAVAGCVLALLTGRVSAENATTPGEVTTPYPTIINLAVEWKIQGDDNLNAVCAVRYRKAGEEAWREALPLRRVPAGKSQGTTPIFSWENKFSGSIFDLVPNTEYEIELKLSDADGGSAEKVVRARTRPAPRIPPGAEINELPAGQHEVLETKSGTPERPVVYRSRDGSAVYKSVNLRNKKWVFVEGLTVNNPDGGHGSKGVILNGAENCVVRRCKINAVYGILAYTPGAKNCYLADNVIQGIVPWENEAMGASGKNIGEGIEITGPGNVVCHNRVTGFRDCLSTMEDRGTCEQVCMDFYHNDVYVGADDGMEADFCMSNCRVVRNRFTNCFVGLSSQPGLGGPTYFIRNVMYNLTYAPYKLHRFSSGDVILHNTVVKVGDGACCFAAAKWTHAFFRNNLALGGAGGGKFGGYGAGSGLAVNFPAADASCSFDYNGYGAEGAPFKGTIGGKRFENLEGLRAIEPHGVQVDMSIFAAPVEFPNPPIPERKPPDLRLNGNGAAVDAGVVLPNINDGFAGKAPDLGAHEVGQELPVYGPRPEGVDEESAPAAAPNAAPKKPVVVALPPPPVETAKVDGKLLAEWQARLVERIVAAAKDGKQIQAFVRVGDHPEKHALLGADEKELKVDINGSAMPLRWAWFKPPDYVALVKSFVKDDDAESLLMLAVFLLADGQAGPAEEALARAALVDAARAEALRAAIKSAQPPKEAPAKNAP